MKHLFLTGVFLLSLLTITQAQTDQGTILLGGGINFETSDGSTIFRASPSVGIFVLDDVAVSAKFSLFATKAATSWAVGPLIRLYLFGSDSGKLITQVGVNVGGSKNTDTAVGFEVGAGWAAFLNESNALEFLANFIKTGDSKGSFSLGVGFQFHYD
jgi:hypothetical protein